MQLGETWRANSGGPCSRTRVEAIRASLLGDATGPVRCPRRLTLALDFGRAEPRRVMQNLLRARGLSHAEQLRPIFEDLPEAMLCRVDATLPALEVKNADPDEVLRQAFLLGLSTEVFFDPSRPVIWTFASLTRRLELFDTEGFYA